MLSYREDHEQKFIEFKVSGKVTREEFEAFTQKIQPRLEKWKGIRLVEVIENLDGVEISALMKDIQFGLKNWSLFNRLEKCAVVADKKWVRTLAESVDPLFKPEIKVFQPAQIEEARDWVLH
jgi:hypothetical protein